MKFILFFLLIISSFIISAQTNNDQQSISNFFANGIYITNLKVFIPWNTPFDSITKYGKPRIEKNKNKKTVVYWDSVKILNEIEITLKYFPVKFLNGTYSDFKIVYGLMDSGNTTKAIKFFTDNINMPKKIKSKKGYTMYLWNLNFCNIFIFKSKNGNDNVLEVGKFVNK